MRVKTLLFLATLCSAGIAYSHTGATGIVKQRMDGMKAMSERSKVVADMYKGKTAFDKRALADAADAFVLHGSQMSELFPDTNASRNGSGTESLSAVWEEWDDFSQRIDEFTELSEKLQSAVASTENERQLKKMFSRTANSCSGCHKLYRKPKQ